MKMENNSSHHYELNGKLESILFVSRIDTGTITDIELKLDNQGGMGISFHGIILPDSIGHNIVFRENLDKQGRVESQIINDLEIPMRVYQSIFKKSRYLPHTKYCKP